MTTTPTAPLTLDAAPEQLKVVAYLVTGLSSGEPSICFEDERGDYGDEDHMPVFDALCSTAEAQSALSAQAATIAQLEEDARRYRWLRDKANDEPGRAPMVVMVDGEFSVTWRDCRIGADLDCAIDAAIAAHGKDAT